MTHPNPTARGAADSGPTGGGAGPTGADAKPSAPAAADGAPPPAAADGAPPRAAADGAPPRAAADGAPARAAAAHAPSPAAAEDDAPAPAAADDAPPTPGPQRPRAARERAGRPALDAAEKAALAWAHTARFLTTASQLVQLPATELPEIAFVGRSNAGKSTAINTLTQQRRLAFASKTPGRTQHINLFELGPRTGADALFADLPGYGYAAVARDAKLRWQEVMAEYLAVRRSLDGVVLMVDARHGFTDLDRRLLSFVAPRVGNGSVRLLVLLTKADKLSRKEARQALSAAQAELGEITTDEADVGVTLFSALDKTGVADAAVLLHRWTRAQATP